MIKKIKLSKSVYKKLKEIHLKDKVERLTFLKGNLVKDSGVVLVSSPEQIIVPESQQSSQYHVGLKKDEIAEVYSQIIHEGYNAIINVHDHWFANVANFSQIDDIDDSKIGKWFQNELPKHLENDQEIFSGSLLISQKQLAARTYNNNLTTSNVFDDIQIDVIAASLKTFSKKTASIKHSLHMRHSFLPEAAINNISQSTIVIVGAGGLGAIAFESALRTGFKEVILIDHDKVESHNLNRLQGVTSNDVGRYKVDALQNYGKRLFPDAKIRVSNRTVYDETSLKLLKKADLIIGALDCNDARWYLNRFANQYLVPYFDAGVSINQKTKESVPVFNYRINHVIPGSCTCGHCSELIWFERQTPDIFLNKKVKQEKINAGYIQNQNQQTSSPAVYSINQKAVADLFIQILNYYSGWPLHSIVSRSSEKTIKLDLEQNIPEDCPVCNFLMGQGDSLPLPKTNQ